MITLGLEPGDPRIDELMPPECALYLRIPLDKASRRQTVNAAISTLFARRQEFDTIVVTGISGLLIGPSVADQIERSICVVRKACDRRHSTSWVESAQAVERWIFLDDCVESGRTLRRVKDLVARRWPASLYIGTYTYGSGQLEYK